MNSRNILTLKSYPIKVGITFGDPSGIGPTIVVKALPRIRNLAEFTVIGDWGVFKKAGARNLKTKNYRFIDLSNVESKSFAFGKVRAEYGKASLEYLNKALDLIEHKEIDCLVTSPISKEAIGLAGFNSGGHTEYLAKRTNTNDFVMMLLNRELKISLVTRHIPLKDVPLKMNQVNIQKTIFLTYKSLKELFSINNPRIAVCGLNPHASDNGLIGNEENRIIKPALKKIKAKLRCVIDRPIPVDIAILRAKEKKYDCVIAIYHDQALIALKLTGKESGVNITLGLPFIRTSPLHGTAFDIAGTNLPQPDSLIEAIKLAIRCTQNQKRA
jgi:4-hydroxythreonine-4-phosphate dehydrogenase